MPIQQNRPQFKAATMQEEVLAPPPRLLSTVRSSTVKSLYWRHRLLQVFSLLWLLQGLLAVAASLGAFAHQLPGIAEEDAELVGAAALGAGLLGIATAAGCWLRASWGRFCGLVFCLIPLIKFPYGTAWGICGLIVLFRSSQLFGANRFAGDELVTEHRHRRKLYAAG